MPGDVRHLRNGLAVLVLVLGAVALTVLQLPATTGISPAPEPAAAVLRPYERVEATPPRLVPESPTAEAVDAAPVPPTSTTSTTTPPPTTTSTTPPTTAAPASRPDRIRAMVDFPFEQVAPAWQIRFHDGGPDGLLGIADQDTRTIHVYVQPDAGDVQLAFTLAHEMAHALDDLHMTPDERAEYRSLRGIPQAVDWLWAWDGGSEGDFGMPAGDFAESFAVATTGETGPWASRLGDPPSPAVQQRVVEMASAV